MIERYTGNTAFGSNVDLEVSVRLTENDQYSNASYELEVSTHISGTPFKTRFGEGYMGLRNFDDLITSTNIAATPAALKDYLVRSTPNLSAEFIPAMNEIKICRIERNAIIPGQRFCERTLRQLLDITPQATSIFLDWVTNYQTRELVLPVLEGAENIRSIERIEHGSALISALTSVGFSRLCIVRQGSKDFGIRGFRSRDVTWSWDPLPPPTLGWRLRACA